MQVSPISPCCQRCHRQLRLSGPPRWPGPLMVSSVVEPLGSGLCLQHSASSELIRLSVCDRDGSCTDPHARFVNDLCHIYQIFLIKTNCDNSDTLEQTKRF